jgi:uncharacterized protein YbjT (DUF2867 family)
MSYQGISKEAAMRVLVMGANGGTGQLVVGELQSRGHEVTAFVRRPETWSGDSVRLFNGDAMNCDDVRQAVQGQDAVVVLLGIRENPLLVRLRGSDTTPINVRSAGTQNVVEGMREHGIRRLVVQTTYGVSETRIQLPAKWKIIFSLLLKPQIADTEKQERVVRNSGLDWTVVQPVGLTNDRDAEPVLVSASGVTRGMTVSRKSVARVLADAIEESKYVRKCIAVSA